MATLSETRTQEIENSHKATMDHTLLAIAYQPPTGPNYSKVAGFNPITTTGDRSDIICVLQDRLVLSEATMTQFCDDIYVAIYTSAHRRRPLLQRSVWR